MMTLRIAETSTSTYHYHLVRATTEEPKQGKLEAICGLNFTGWETVIPVDVWGVKDHLPSKWCQDCTEKKNQRCLGFVTTISDPKNLCLECGAPEGAHK
jgi:hypothetical protein